MRNLERRSEGGALTMQSQPMQPRLMIFNTRFAVDSLPVRLTRFAVNSSPIRLHSHLPSRARGHCLALVPHCRSSAEIEDGQQSPRAPRAAGQSRVQGGAWRQLEVKKLGKDVNYPYDSRTAQGAWPRRGPFRAVRSRARAARIVRAPVNFQKRPHLTTSARSPTSSLRFLF